MIFVRQILAFTLIILLFGCSTRQAFQEYSGNQDGGWWQCNPKGERDWSCSDGQKISGTKNSIDKPSDQAVIDTSVDTTEESLESGVTQLIKEDNKETQGAIEEGIAETLEEQKVEQVVISDEVFAEESATENSITMDIKPENVQATGEWVIQLGAFRSESEAQKLADRIPNAQVNPATSDNWFRVVWGGFFSREAAEQAASDLKQDYSGLNTWVRKN